MIHYLLRRLLLLPATLFFIILVNFVIINQAPGDPISVTEISPEGGATRQEGGGETDSDQRYLSFREFFGLTRPVLWNLWPSTPFEFVEKEIQFLSDKKNKNLSVKEFHRRKIEMGDRARFIMPHLFKIAEDSSYPLEERAKATHFIARGGRQFPKIAPSLTREERKKNEKIANEIAFLNHQIIYPDDTLDQAKAKSEALKNWYEEVKRVRGFEPSFFEKGMIFFTETRFSRYFSRVATLDFGVLRGDESKTVISEVIKRFKYSLTLAVIPLFITFFLCQIFGFTMALKRGKSVDYSLNLLFLTLYAIPVFVVAPFLIEKIALHRTFPFTDIPIPYSGFQSVDSVFEGLTTKERLFDIASHICLPLVAVMYNSLAAQSRLCRTAVLEVLRQDFVRTAYAKGLSTPVVLFKHVGRNSAITILTSLAGSLGVVLGGSLIIETVFEIDGFGRFFYQAIIDRDYNVIMFSALAGSFLSLLGYLIADICYTILDPRITLD